MKISGTYWDRLLLVSLPLWGLVALIYLLVHNTEIKNYESYWSFFVFFSFPIMILENLKATRKTKPLYIKETVYIGDQKIDLNNIVKITQIEEGVKKQYRTLEFQVLDKGEIQKFRVLPKPVFIIKDLMGYQSSTMQILLERFPELKERSLEKVK